MQLQYKTNDASLFVHLARGFFHNGESCKQVLLKCLELVGDVGQDLKTDAEGVPQYRGMPFMTSAGPCTSSIPLAIVK